MRIIVSGLAALHPVGGVTWDYLQYVIGLADLGHDVYYHEDTWSWPFDPERNAHTDDPGYSVRYLGEFFARYAPGLSKAWHYRHLHEQSFGMSASAFDEVARGCDLFLNVSGASAIPEQLPGRCRTVFLDTDPGYNQIVLRERPAWSENVERWADAVAAHDRHFTYAENIAGADCAIPDVGLSWRPTRMPIPLPLWDGLAGTPTPARAPWTTVMSWGVFKGPLVLNGTEYRGKEAEFAKILALPAVTGLPMSLALGGVADAAARERLVDTLGDHGWSVVDGPGQTRTPELYRTFLARSRGEISVAKNVYVALRTGWFSCRTACYLAAGRPAVVQDTGFGAHLPTGEGLLAFDSAAQAADALARVEQDYARHARAARELAREHFDARKVLAKLVDDAMDSGTGGNAHAGSDATRGARR